MTRTESLPAVEMRRTAPRPLRRLLLAAALPLLAACARAVPAAEPAPQCVLPDAPLLIAFGEIEAEPGQVDTLRLFTSTHPGAIDDLPESCRPAWSLSEDAPASLDEGGVLRIADGAPDGATFTVSARVADRETSATVRVVDPAASPLVGTWTEVGRTPCPDASDDAPSDEPIRELRFRGDGRFSVTWTPFESYVDYAGTYAYDPETGSLRMEVDFGNHVPDDLDLDGHARFDGADVLELSDLRLGSRAPGAAPACAWTFRRQGG